MYDDVDASSGVFDFDGGSRLMSQQHKSMYVDDDDYVADLYTTSSRSRLEELAAAVQDRENVAYYERISVSDLFDQCVFPTLSQAFYSVFPIAALCIVCRMSVLFCHTGLFICF